MGTVINNPEIFSTLTMLNSSTRFMKERNKESLSNGGEVLYGSCLDKETKLYKKYLKKLVGKAA